MTQPTTRFCKIYIYVYLFFLFFLNLLCRITSCLHYEGSPRPKPRRSRFKKCESWDCDASMCTLGKTSCADYISVTSSGRHDISFPTLFCSQQWKMSKVKVEGGKAAGLLPSHIPHANPLEILFLLKTCNLLNTSLIECLDRHGNLPRVMLIFFFFFTEFSWFQQHFGHKTLNFRSPNMPNS